MMMIIYKQFHKTTKIEIYLGATYNADCQAGTLIKFLKRVHTICFERDNGGLLFGPYKQVVVVKTMKNYSNNQPHDPHGFKEEVRIKYNSLKDGCYHC